MKKLLILGVILCSSIATAQAKEKSEITVCQPDSPVKYCIACHGEHGAMTDSKTPMIQGMPKGYIAKQLLDFKSGKRVSSEMNALMPYISEKQIEILSEHYSLSDKENETRKK